MSVFEDLDREPGQPRQSDLWEWARDDYKAGETADVVCERHGLSRSRFYERARDEGWLRRDQPRRSPAPAYDEAAEDAAIEALLQEAPPSAFEIQRLAWARMHRAILMNRRMEAQGWARLAATLRKLAVQETQGAATWSGVLARTQPDAPDSRSPPNSGGGGREAVGGGELPHDVGRSSTDTRSETAVHGSPPPSSAMVALPRCAGEALPPDSPDSRIPAALWARLNRPEGAMHPDVHDAWIEVTRLFEGGPAQGLPAPPETSRALSTA